MAYEYWYLTSAQKEQAKALELLGWCFYGRIASKPNLYIKGGVCFDGWRFLNSDSCYIEAVVNNDAIFSFCTDWKALDSEYIELIALAKSGFKGVVKESKSAIKLINSQFIAPQLALF